MMRAKKPPSWLDVPLGRGAGPMPPALDSDRMKELISQALLSPSTMRPQDIQEMGAAVLTHLVNMPKE